MTLMEANKKDQELKMVNSFFNYLYLDLMLSYIFDDEDF